MSHSVEQRNISAEAANAAVVAAIGKAAELGIRINVAVTDSAGVLTAFLRMPGAFLHSVDIAIDKAYTAAGFGFATADWPAILQSDEALRLGMPTRPRNVVFGGGLPIRENGVLIGGIGVSGGSAEQDEQCGQAGLDALGLGSEPMKKTPHARLDCQNAPTRRCKSSPSPELRLRFAPGSGTF